MKYMVILLFTILVNPVNAQQKHIELIERFVEALKVQENTMQYLYDEAIIKAPEKNNDNGDSSYDFYQAILDPMRDHLENCKKRGNSYEFITSKDGIKREVIKDIDIPENGSVYLIYCNEDLIIPILIEDEYITSFSTINKGGKRIFMML